MMGEWGYYNRFDGFHRTTDTYAYVGLFKCLFGELFHGRVRSAKWVWLRMIWYRWHHRMCDTTDFHHDFGCLRDKRVRKEDDEYRWTRVWKDHHKTKEHDGNRDLRH